MNRGKKLIAVASVALLTGLAAFPGQCSVLEQTEDTAASRPGSVVASDPKQKAVLASRTRNVDAAHACRPGSFEALMSAKLPPNMRPANRDYSGCH